MKIMEMRNSARRIRFVARLLVAFVSMLAAFAVAAAAVRASSDVRTFPDVLPAASQDSGVPPDAKAAIAAANAAWLTAMKTGDAATIAEPYGKDAIFVGPTGAVAHGPDGVAQLMRDRFGQAGTVTAVSLAQEGVTRQGALIYEWGHAEIDVTRAGAAPVRSRGRYLTVWQKNPTGRWQILRNLSLPD